MVGVRQHAGDSQVVAFVALRDPSGLPTLQQFVAERVPPEHRPHRIISVMALPRTHNGKVLKRELRLDANIALSRQANGSGILHHDDAALRAPLLASSGSTKVLLP